LSAKEQSAVASARQDVLNALAEANERYLERFGFIFIVCATGKSADEMLKMLRDRLSNDRATELRIAAEEQAKITALRLR
jgi:OHCU decarboxylase